ncbi:MAG TPA: hypothetical protein VF637_01345, partial [Sphingomicrobium sp.]
QKGQDCRAGGCNTGLLMHVVEILLPLRRNDGSDQPKALFGQVRRELLDRFGGLTAFSRAPADGLWESDEGGIDRDAIVIFEVMVEAVDRAWWTDFRKRLEALFAQDAVVIRASAAERL